MCNNVYFSPHILNQKLIPSHLLFQSEFWLEFFQNAADICFCPQCFMSSSDRDRTSSQFFFNSRWKKKMAAEFFKNYNRNFGQNSKLLKKSSNRIVNFLEIYRQVYSFAIRELNPNWHEGWYFYLLVIYQILSAEFLSKISKLF